jgi:hypothetical protein
MPGVEWLLELVLTGLLAATLFHAVRLERALGVLKRDRAALEELVAGFNASTRQAELGIERLRAAADGAGQQLAKRIESAASLKDDLVFLNDRGGRLADRMDKLVRAARPLATQPQPQPPRTPAAEPEPEAPRPRSQAERDLIKALKLVRSS